ncbi:hypothetical protein AgCh_029630 [Apium graveolens]
MGGTSSKPDSYRQSSSSWNHNDYYQSSSYPQSNQNYAPPTLEAYPYPSYRCPAYNQQPNNPPPPPQVHSSHGNKPQRKFGRRYSRIAANYNLLDEVLVSMMETRPPRVERKKPHESWSKDD